MSTQVDHLEVVNKQYVKVIPAQGVNTSEVVSCKKSAAMIFAFFIGHSVGLSQNGGSHTVRSKALIQSKSI